MDSAIGAIFENYKMNVEEDKLINEEVSEAFATFHEILELSFPGRGREEHKKQQNLFHSACSYALESEKNGFMIGFKMAVNLMQECKA